MIWIAVIRLFYKGLHCYLSMRKPIVQWFEFFINQGVLKECFMCILYILLREYKMCLVNDQLPVTHNYPVF